MFTNRLGFPCERKLLRKNANIFVRISHFFGKKNFAKKAKLFAFFASLQNAKKCEIIDEIFFREKWKIFAKRFTLSAGNPKSDQFGFVKGLW